MTIWHWMTDRQAAFEELARRYEKASGTKVVFELYAPSEAYSQKVRAAAQGVTLPDIFGVLGVKRDFAAYVKAGHILNLTPSMEFDDQRWRKTFFTRALAVNEFLPDNSYGVTAGIYGVPLDVMTIQMVYNKALFRDIGLNPQRPPATFQEFLDIGKKIKEKKLQGLVSGWAELWMIDCLTSNYAFNIMGKDKFMATIRGEVVYTDPDWIKVFSLFREMERNGVLGDGIVTMVNKTAEQLFATNKAVFAFNGSWAVNNYESMNPNLEYGVMLPPKVSGQYPMAIWGGAGSSLMVNARSPMKEEAVKFLKWMTDIDQQAYLAQATSNLPANKNCIGMIPDILSQFVDDIEATTHPNTWEQSEFPVVSEAINQGIQLIIMRKKSPEQLAAEVQKIKARELANAKAQERF